MYSIDKIKDIIKGEGYFSFPQIDSIKEISTDSRTIVNGSQTLFFAIETNNNNGHRYIEQAYSKGVRCFVITDNNYISNKANFIFVNNSLEALQTLATYHRKQFSLPIIGITGSNGKTIVKEWFAQVAQTSFSVVKNPKSYNSQLGVPFSLWQIEASHTLGVFEAGISLPNEMQRLANMIDPEIGLITNIGAAHQEGFTDLSYKLNEKLGLFSSCKKVIYCIDHILIHKNIQSLNAEKISWGKHQDASIRIIEIHKKTNLTSIELFYKNQFHSFNIPFIDDVSIENTMHVIALSLAINLSPIIIESEIQKLKTVEMRLEVKKGIHDSIIVDDSYINDLASLRIALDFLDVQPYGLPRLAILSDMSDASEISHYEALNNLLIEKRVDYVVGIGEAMLKYQSCFKIKNVIFPTIDEFLALFDRTKLSKQLVLIKGARKYGFERIVSEFQQLAHGTKLEINLNALIANLHYLKSKLPPKTKTMVMVKAFAYGSGSIEIAQLLQFHQIDYLAVAYTDEGVVLREKGIRTPIMVMNENESFDKHFTFDLEPEIYTLEQLKLLLKTTEKYNRTIGIHLKLDTGMHRLGFVESEIETLKNQLINQPKIIVKSIFSHLAAADEPEKDGFTDYQIHLFEKMSGDLISSLKITPLRHLLNSAGVMRFPKAAFDMVRLGIGLYGVGVNEEEQLHLQTVGTLSTTISQIKSIEKTETVGYGRKGIVNTHSRIATIAIGYADGYDRRFSNGVGNILVNGVLCPVIGNVCMDMTMIDVTLTNTQAGDRVIIFGENPTVSSLAKSIGTIPYELLTKIGERVRRTFVYG